MSYQLKATGIAANCTMLIAVDPHDSTVKDFASSSVTSTLTFNSSTTSSIGTAAWNGLTRSYVSLVDPSDIAFGANKPQLVHDSTTATQFTVAAGVEIGSTLNGVIFGADVSSYFATRNTSAGGSTHPAMRMVNVRNGSLDVTAGEKRVFGWNSVYSGSYTSSWWSALHDDVAMTTGVPSPSNLGSDSWALDYIGRRSDDTANAFNGKLFFVAIFDTALTEAQWDSLRDDWFGTLLEVAEPASETITLTPDPAAATTADATKAFTTARSAPASGNITYNLTSSNTGVATVPATDTILDTESAGGFDATIVGAGTTTITITNAADSGETDSVVLTVSTIKGISITTGQASETALRWAWFDGADPSAWDAPSAQGSGESTDGSGVLTITLTGTALNVGDTGYLVVNKEGATAEDDIVFAGRLTVQDIG